MSDQTRTTMSGGADAAADAEQHEKLTADENWARYEHGRDRGHAEYCRRARRLEDIYLGGGSQWKDDDRADVEADGRLALEINEIKPAVDAAVGYQIANRMDIGFQPRGGEATQEMATILSKVAMQVADNTELHSLETEVFSDGLIQRAGYFELRISFDDTMRGEIDIETLDPMDVIPDPDAKTYSPDGWGDVITLRWQSLDEIEQLYGREARDKAEEGAASYSDSDFGDDDDTEARNKFGDGSSGARSYDAIRRDKHMTRVRVIKRQKWVYQMVKVVISPDTGNVEVVEDMDPEQLERRLAAGGVLSRRMARRVRWIVTTRDAVLQESWSPFPFITVFPYFPYFRRGKKRGMVDGGEGPQMALNKGISKYFDILNTQSNSGWLVEEGSLVDMEPDDLEVEGSKNGVVIVYRKGTTKPEKIAPALVPTGLDRIIERMSQALSKNTVPDAARGIDDDDVSGVSRQSKMFAAQQQLAIALDNLGRTRRMLVRAMLWCIQHYYDEERLWRISKPNPATGEEEEELLRINVWNEATQTILNDVTVGEYKLVITEVPMQVTFENGQFEQAIKMRAEGVKIPDDVVVRNSALSDKQEVIRRMAKQGSETDPLVEAEINLKKAQIDKLVAEAVNKRVESQFSAIQTAQTIAGVPATAPLADALLLSAGYQDADAAPIVPELQQGIDVLPPAPNTNPLTPRNPASPAVGVNQGIETARADSIEGVPA